MRIYRELSLNSAVILAMKKAIKLALVLALIVSPGSATAEEATEIINECEQSENCTVYILCGCGGHIPVRHGGVVIPPDRRFHHWSALIPIRWHFMDELLKSEEDI